MSGIQQITPQLPNNDPQGFLLGNSIIGDFNTLTNNNSGYGVLPAVEKNQTYFAYFSSVGGTGPEIIDQTAYFLKYLIDAQGNVVTPQPNSIDVINMVQNFESGKVVNVTSLEGTTLFSSLLGTKTITDVGKIDTIAVSQTGSGIYDYVTTLNFTSPGTLYTNADWDFSFLVRKSTSLNQSFYTDAFQVVTFNYETLDPNNQYVNTVGNYYYQFGRSTTVANNPVSFKTQLLVSAGEVTVDGIYAPSVPSATVVLRFMTASATAPTAFNHILAQNTYNIGYLPWEQLSTITFESPFYNFASGSRVRVEASITQNLNPYLVQATTVPPYIKSSTSTYFTLKPSYVTNITATSPYFTTGSANDVCLTSSIALNNAYYSGLISKTPSASLAMNFSAITNIFRPQPGDYIRFEYNPLKTYKIYEIIENEYENVIFRLNKEILEGTNINNFVIFRVNPNSGNQIILDVPKPPGTTGQILTGFLKPQFMSDELENNFTTIIQKLVAEGTI